MTIYHHHHHYQEEAKARPELLVPRAVGVPQDPQRLYDYMIMILLLTNDNIIIIIMIKRKQKLDQSCWSPRQSACHRIVKVANQKHP